MMHHGLVDWQCQWKVEFLSLKWLIAGHVSIVGAGFSLHPMEDGPCRQLVPVHVHSAAGFCTVAFLVISSLEGQREGIHAVFLWSLPDC